MRSLESNQELNIKRRRKLHGEERMTLEEESLWKVMEIENKGQKNVVKVKKYVQFKHFIKLPTKFWKFYNN